ncbi:prepilin-type N-terminal cleavage/methylation domain-containing protein [Clostridium botulinum]|uniref:PulJ/GspJ family protein n=1 Tax=Clostridium botulinum TaxID=1491 RepID=UPI000773A996|nr:prepilin-type N-terminal cleavage/methylation domain-containing protein [Clostridium botulinum]NFE85747.1 prepilin-type N-terminal cleavage/methylation domain-containing protein [Clostridium botulinum]NFG27583.1 prepilin-type N-terminal cleavage/methylation domain-containing protein [Clostridium botulinum]NFG39446.1 prepilin-type N-terminal cleavage/methylation domain-containing protein [Clostridium botulinum]NFN29816.1 prepilin-type N-terminal cleavage/methylation domain-containing protein 
MKNIYKRLKIPMLKISNKNKGFTLIEIIIAFTLFAIMMGGIYGIVISAMNINKAGEVKQKAALYGQQIFEDIKGGNIINSGDDYNISGINFKCVSSNKTKFEGNKDLDSGYSAKIILEKVNNITLDKDDGTSENNQEFKYTMETSENGYSIKIKNSDENITLTNNEEKVRFSIEVKTNSNSRNVIIKSDNAFNQLSDTKTITTDDKDKVMVSFNFYKLKSADEAKKDVEIEIYNKDNIPLNIALKKPEDLKIDLVSKEGKVREFTNRGENDDNGLGELYSITTEIKDSKGNIQFTGHAMYNIYIK